MKQWFVGILVLLALLTGSAVPAKAAAAVSQSSITTRVKDIARLQGVRNNQLSGMGLVVGLNGSGDASRTNVELIANVLQSWGIDIDVSNLRTKNVAAVMVTATLPPYMHEGDTIDIQVASWGDAKSLQGGVLLQTPLTGADGNVYAVAQGPVYLGGYAAGARGTSVQKNITTTGIVPSGAIIEREVPMQLQNGGKLRWVLNNPDFTTAVRLAETINENIARNAARAVNMGLVEVDIPLSYSNNPVPFIAEIETLAVTPDGIAKVIVNERNGTVVIGDKVKIASVAVTHRNITVRIESTPQVSQPPPFSRGETEVVDDVTVDVDEEEGSLILLPAGTDIGTIVRALNAVGTTPQDIIAILVAIKESGALYGVLEFI